MSILFVIESPGKIAKISSILGKNYKVVATMGHFRDLDPKKMSIDFDNHFEPIYIITKPNIVKKLRDSMKNTKMVYLAADPDREGSAIAQSVYDVLKPKKYKRILYNAITKQAIMEAIANAGEIDQNLVNAQKARRVIDRLFGYLISPILQKQLGGALSAGRVQSATLRLVVDKEDEIKKFIEETQHTSFFRVSGKLLSQKDNNLELKLEPQNGPNFSGNFSKLKVVLYESLDKNPFDVQKSYQGEIACLPLADDNHPNAKVIIFLKRSLKSEF
ncbi:MAG: DNA topoisomerase, partial [Nitrososphaerota archaeon]